jgi:hypothetical protein
VSSVAIESPSSRIAKGVDRIDGSPELSLLERIQVSRSLPPLGSGELFFGDVAGQSGASIPPAWATFDAVVPQSAARKRLSASEGWVDVRGAFIGQPELGQAIGGVVTTSRYSMLPVDAGRSILVNVLRGRLISSDGREVTRETVGYSWVTLPEGTKNVVCSGECVVAAEGTPPSLRSPSVPVALQMPLSAPVPWLAWTTLPPRNTETVLKYLVGYDRTMLAISRSGTLPHVRVETVFNGWLVAPHEGTRRVVLIDALAAVQVFLELTGLALLLALSWLLLGVKRSNVEFSE